MLDIRKFQAKPVSAVKVTKDNMAEIAEWCGGKMITHATSGKPVLVVPVGNQAQGPKVRSARIGEWVFRESTGVFRLFYEKPFFAIFDEVLEDQPVMDVNDFVRVGGTFDGEITVINEKSFITVYADEIDQAAAQ